MAGGLLGYAASMGQGINSLADWLEERARFAGGRVKRLATDPVGLLGTMAGEAGKPFTDFADAAARGDTQATVEGLLNSGLAGPLTFAGVGAKTADKVALQKAKQMANLGEDPVKIWQTTGWTEQFPDKQWRFEIPDNVAKERSYPFSPRQAFDEYRTRTFIDPVPDRAAMLANMEPYSKMSTADLVREYSRTGKEIVDAATGGDMQKALALQEQRSGLSRLLSEMHTRKSGPASAYISHPRLKEAYPDVANIHTIAADDLGKASGSYFQGDATQGELIRSSAFNPPKDTMLHEWQHAIQQREGFARGGSPEDEGLKRLWADKMLTLAPQKIEQLTGQWESAIAKAGSPAAAKKANPELWKEMMEWDSWAQAAKLNDASIVAGKYMGPDAKYNAYRSLAGEAEARLTQTRMNLTPAERMQHPPWLSGPYGFDVPPEQQIVRGLLGEQTGPAMQTVYHGTPHTWQPEPGFPQGRFRLDKLGTGEGAAAYGPGAYWAEAQTTGETYRHSLSDHAIEIGGRKINPERGSIEDRAAAWVQGAVDAQSSEGPFQYAKKQVRSILGKSSSVADDIVKQIEKWQEQGATVGKGGNLYKTDLPDEVLPKMLQWDKPLSEQPETVQSAVKNIVEDHITKAFRDGVNGNTLESAKSWLPWLRGWMDNPGSVTGEGVYRILSSGAYPGAGVNGPGRAANFLGSSGIPGLSYLDAGSRKGGKGTMNHVVWDQELLNRMKPEPVGGLLGQQ